MIFTSRKNTRHKNKFKSTIEIDGACGSYWDLVEDAGRHSVVPKILLGIGIDTNRLIPVCCCTLAEYVAKGEYPNGP